MKKIISIFALIIFSAVVSQGCGSESPSNDPESARSSAETVNEESVSLETAESAEEALDSVEISDADEEPQPSFAPTETQADPKNFTLTREQASELMTDVAAPLLLTEWYAVMDYPDVYDPEDWKDLRHVDVSDFDNLTAENTAYWNEFVYSMAAASYYDEASNTERNVIFEDDAAFIDLPHGEFTEPGIYIELPVFEQYFNDAFGIELPDVLNVPALEYEIGIDQNSGMYRILILDSLVNAAISELPSEDVQVINGKVTFNGEIVSFDFYEFAWDIPNDAIPWDITLDVVKNEDSRFGCNVTGFQVSAADMDIPADEIAG